MTSESGLNTTASVDIHVSPLALCSSILTKREPDVTSIGNAIESPHTSVRIVCSGANSVHTDELALSASLGRTRDDPTARLSAAMKLGHDVTDDTDSSSSFGVSRSEASERPNIVMVSIDSLRADHCGFLGDTRGLTPTMDRLAAEGVAYENAIAPGPQTFSSMPAIFTGHPRQSTTLESYPQASHWERRLAAIANHFRLTRSLPERLQALGYETAGVTPNPWTTAEAGFDRGFDHFDDCSTADSGGIFDTVLGWLPGVDTDTRAVQLAVNMVAGSEFFAQWETLIESVRRFHDTLSEPYFLWVFVLDTHFPFLPSRRHREEQSLFGTYYGAYRSAEPMRGNAEQMTARALRSVKRSYRDTVRASDTFLRQLQSDLAADDPVIIVHADHGESFGDHDNYGHHHREVFEENVHVPYLIHNAGSSDTVSAPTSLTSLPETTLAIAKGTFDPSITSSTPVITTSECGTHRAVRGPRYKYIESDGAHALFDLDADPREEHAIADAVPEQTRQFQQRLRSHDRHLAELRRLGRATTRVVADRTV